MKNNNSQRMLLIPHVLYEQFRESCDKVGFTNVYVIRHLLKVYSERELKVSESMVQDCGDSSVKKISIVLSKSVNDAFRREVKKHNMKVSSVINALLSVFIRVVESKDFEDLSEFREFVETFEKRKWWDYEVEDKY